MKAKEVKRKKQIIKDGIVVCQMPPQTEGARWTVIISSQPGDNRSIYIHIGKEKELEEQELLEMCDKITEMCRN